MDVNYEFVVDGHLGWLNVLAVKDTAVNIHVHALCVYVFSLLGILSRSEFPGYYVNSTLKHLRKSGTVLHNRCIILYSTSSV